MRRLLNILAAAVLAVLLVGYAVAYSVDYNEAVIVTTLGGADEGAVKNPPGGEGAGEAGLHFKWPWPIQQVRARYDTRVQILEAAVEQVQTADQQTIILRVSLAWRVADPLAFYKSLGNPAAAERQLRARVRAANGLVGDYRFDELANLDGQGTALEELADRIRREVQAGLAADYGLVVEDVGITKLELPPSVTQTVFARMREERGVLARRARELGESEGRTLQTEARSTAETILAFARQQAAEIESRGERAGAEALAELEGPAAELAMLLDELQTIERSINQRDRWFIRVADLYPFNTLSELTGTTSDAQGTDAREAE